MQPKVVAMIVAASLTSGWLLASLLSPPVAQLQALPDRSRPRVPARDSGDAPYTEQLHLKLQDAPLPPVPRRNPFTFGTARPQASRSVEAPRPRVEERPAAPLLDVSAATGAPPFRLAGIGVTNTADREVRTAVLSDGGDVHLVKVGDTVRSYRVTAITDDEVTLVTASGEIISIRMR